MKWNLLCSSASKLYLVFCLHCQKTNKVRRTNSIYIPRPRSTYNASCGQRTHPCLSLASRLLITSALRKAEPVHPGEGQGRRLLPRGTTVSLGCSSGGEADWVLKVDYTRAPPPEAEPLASGGCLCVQGL